jgi:hypothetical protein
VQQILQSGYAPFEQGHALPGNVRKAVCALRACPTARLGGHLQAWYIREPGPRMWTNYGSWPFLGRPVEESTRAVGAGSKRCCVREPARSVITRQPCHVTRHWSMSRRWSGRQENAAGQPIKPGSAIPVPVQHLQPIDLACNGALTPGPGYGGPVGPKSFGEVLEGREGARSGAHQPRLQLGWRALAGPASTVRRECHRRCPLGRQRGQRRQLGVIVSRGACGRAEDQPGGPTRREPAWCHRWHRR